MFLFSNVFYQWHLGFFQTDYTPTKRGFDSFFGYWGGKEDYWDHSNLAISGQGLDFRNGTEVSKHYRSSVASIERK